MAWYKQWFGEEYLELYAHRDEGEAERHVDFVESLLAGRQPRAILDLAGLKEYEQREDGERRVEIRRWWDPQQRRVNKRIRIGAREQTKPAREARTFLESVRAYTLDEVTMGLRWAGLEVEATFGSFAG